jgi:hypothetical protein
MNTRKLVAAAMVMACLALGACGSDEDGSGLPTTGTRVERTTTVPSGTEEPDQTTEPAPTRPEGGVSTTESPTTETPTTETPTTETPTTETPTTETPTTGPRTTRESAAGVQTTETPTTETPTTEALATEPVAAEDDGTTWWPWLLVGLLIIGLIAFLASRRSGKAPTWKQKTAAAFDEATSVATHLAAVGPDGAAMVATQDAGQLAALAATLSTRVAETENPNEQRVVASVRDQVQALHAVVDGIAMGSTPVTPATHDYLRERAIALHGAVDRGRAELFPQPQQTGAAPV